jgi:DNA-binding NtrC family response regulator
VDLYTTQVITETLRENNWNKTHTARKLGISRQTLINKIKRLNIRP